MNEVQGLNSRLDELQAAILLTKMPLLEAWNARRAAVAARYTRELQGLPLGLPSALEGAEPVWHLYVVRSANRDRLQTLLKERGVETMIHYPIPPHQQAAYRDFGPRNYPLATAMAREVLSLPIGPHLTDKQQTHVIAAVREASLQAARAA